MNWNKEKIVFLCVALASALVLLLAGYTVTGSSPGQSFARREPVRFEGASSEEIVDWVLQPLQEARRDPYQRVSDWQQPPPDPLPPPGLAELERRVPPPALLLRTPGTRPPREKVPPAPVDESAAAPGDPAAPPGPTEGGSRQP